MKHNSSHEQLVQAAKAQGPDFSGQAGKYSVTYSTIGENAQSIQLHDYTMDTLQPLIQFLVSKFANGITITIEPEDPKQEYPRYNQDKDWFDYPDNFGS